MCDRCEMLERELDDMARKLDQVMRQLEKLKQALERIRAFCGEVVSRSDAILSQPSGVPRGKWAFARGAKEIAARVLALTQVC